MGSAGPPRVFSVDEIRDALARVGVDKIVQCQAEAFVAYSAGLVSVPAVQTMGQPPLAPFVGHPDAQACVKSAYENGGEVFITKVASGGGGVNSGLVLVFSQRDFAPKAVLLDGGLLTEVRTAAACALAAKHLAPPSVGHIAMIGAGVQARFQLRALASVTTCRRVKIWARSPAKVAALVAELAVEGWDAEAAPGAREACAKAGLVVTATPSRGALVRNSWLQGRHVLVIAVGADAPGKQELELEILANASMVVVDSRAQCVERGEAQHAVAAGALEAGRLVEFGKWLSAGGRARPNGIVVFDTTGVAVQDVKIAEVVLQELARVGSTGGPDAKL